MEVSDDGKTKFSMEFENEVDVPPVQNNTVDNDTLPENDVVNENEAIDSSENDENEDGNTPSNDVQTDGNSDNIEENSTETVEER